MLMGIRGEKGDCFMRMIDIQQRRHTGVFQTIAAVNGTTWEPPRCRSGGHARNLRKHGHRVRVMLTAKGVMDQAVEAKMTGRGMFALIAAHFDIEWQEERLGEKRIGTNPDGSEKWTRSNWPDSFNTIEEALGKVGRVKAMWYHAPSMNLILDDGIHKAGVRSTDFRIFGLGFKPERIQALIDGLAVKMRTGA